MIRIDRLHIRLPDNFGHRAETIGRLVVQSLGRLSIADGRERRIRQVHVPDITVSPGDSDQAVADGITGQIIQRIGRQHD